LPTPVPAAAPTPTPTSSSGGYCGDGNVCGGAFGNCRTGPCGE
jgi:hypothetical protein